jgi:hypothetical protein
MAMEKLTFPSKQAIFSSSWAIANLVRVRRLGVLMPSLIAAIMHGGLALFMVFTSLQGVDELLRSHVCRLYGVQKDDAREAKCREWAEKFHILLWAYLISVLIIGYVLTLAVSDRY